MILNSSPDGGVSLKHLQTSLPSGLILDYEELTSYAITQ
jgi:hypothetical protein